MSRDIFGKGICVGGLPGIGSVGKVATDYIGNVLECRTLRSAISPGFPPQVVMANEGMVRTFQVELRASDSLENFLVLSGDAQPLTPNHMYRLAGYILEMISSFQITDLITLAAYVGDSKEAVLGVASDGNLAQALEREGVFLLHDGIIGGLNGLLVGLCPQYNMRGACLMGKTTGEEEVDLAAAVSLVETIGRLLDLDIPLDGLKLEESKGPADEIPIPEEGDVDSYYLAYR
jgi:proteasome assembly chaperone (PAC2) family protein